jgi:hypothetical protein
MFNVQKAILPGTILGIMFLVLVTGLISSPQMGLAPGPAFAAVGEIAAQSIVLELPAPTALPEPTDVPERTGVPEPTAVVEPQAAAHQEGSDGSCSLGSGFPESIRQWCSLIEKYAGESGVDPNLVAAVMLQESGGNPRAYSKSGAVGLMQVMPNDGLAAGFMCINGPCFASRPSSDELYDPEFNISYGTRMLSGLINKNGDIREALRAYGPMNMGYRYADIILGILNRYR